MTTLAKDKPRDLTSSPEGYEILLPMIAADIIYAGAAVGESGATGTFRPLVAADPFAGFAKAKADNSGGAASDVDVEVQQQGMIELAVVGVTAITDRGDDVYAADDDTFTLTSTSNTKIGKLVKVTDAANTKCLVFFQAITIQSA